MKFLFEGQSPTIILVKQWPVLVNEFKEKKKSSYTKLQYRERVQVQYKKGYLLVTSI